MNTYCRPAAVHGIANPHALIAAAMLRGEISINPPEPSRQGIRGGPKIKLDGSPEVLAMRAKNRERKRLWKERRMK